MFRHGPKRPGNVVEEIVDEQGYVRIVVRVTAKGG
jgi:hypothetical protein